MAQVTIIGRMGADPQIHDNGNGRGPFITFPLVENQFKGGQEVPVWYDIIASTNVVGNIQKYLTKGKPIIVTGDLTADLFTRRDNQLAIRLSVRAFSVNFVPFSGGNSQSGGNVVQRPQAAAEGVPSMVDEDAPTAAEPEAPISMKSGKKPVAKKAAPVPAPEPADNAEGDDEDLPF